MNDRKIIDAVVKSDWNKYMNHPLGDLQTVMLPLLGSRIIHFEFCDETAAACSAALMIFKKETAAGTPEYFVVILDGYQDDYQKYDPVDVYVSRISESGDVKPWAIL